MKYKIVSIITFVFFFSVTFLLYSKSKNIPKQEFDLTVKLDSMSSGSLNANKFLIILKNKIPKKKLSTSLEIIPPDGWETSVKSISKVVEKEIEIPVEFKIAPSAKPNIYKIHIKASSNNTTNTSDVYISIPFNCQKTFSPPKISEGYCKPCYWGGKTFISFSKDKNSVVVYPLWDDKNLYFGINVKDKDIHGVADKNNLTAKEDDNVQLFISIQDEISLIKKEMVTYQYTFSATGKYLAERIKENLKPDANFKSKVEMITHIYGTLNNNFDLDNSYWIVAKIPFSEFNIKIGEGTKLKLNVINFDKQTSVIAKSEFFSWSEFINQDNLYNSSLYPEILLVK